MNEEEKIKRISIKGRFALGMRCLEGVLEERKEFGFPIVQKIISQLWTYTESDRLDIWEEKIKGFDPGCILHDKDYDDYEFPTRQEIEEIKRYYLSISLAVREMFENVIMIGINNLYSGTGEFSESTLEPTLKVFKTAKDLAKEIPNIEAFNKFPYSDFHGWGYEFNRNDVP